MNVHSFGRQLVLVGLSWILGFPAAMAALSQDDLLEPEKAFQISTRALDERNVDVRFRIADGYYMYRDRFKFETADGKVLADVELPPGKLKKDEFFGETQTYRREALAHAVLGDDLERDVGEHELRAEGLANVAELDARDVRHQKKASVSR